MLQKMPVFSQDCSPKIKILKIYLIKRVLFSEWEKLTILLNLILTLWTPKHFYDWTKRSGSCFLKCEQYCSAHLKWVVILRLLSSRKLDLFIVFPRVLLMSVGSLTPTSLYKISYATLITSKMCHFAITCVFVHF